MAKKVPFSCLESAARTTITPSATSARITARPPQQQHTWRPRAKFPFAFDPSLSWQMNHFHVPGSTYI